MTIFFVYFFFLVKQLKDYQSFLRVFVQAIHYHSRRRDKPSCLCVDFDLKIFRKFNVFFDYSIFNYLLSLIRQWTRYFLVKSTCYWPLLNSNTGRVFIYLFRFAPNQWNELLSQKTPNTSVFGINVISGCPNLCFLKLLRLLKTLKILGSRNLAMLPNTGLAKSYTNTQCFKRSYRKLMVYFFSFVLFPQNSFFVPVISPKLGRAIFHRISLNFVCVISTSCNFSDKTFRYVNISSFHPMST